MGAAVDAQNRSQPLYGELKGLLNNMLGDEILSPAHDYLGELRRNAPLWKERFVSDATATGRDFFRATLYSEDALWDGCADLWGAGSGFLATVSSRVREWCDSHREINAAVEKRVQQAWKNCFMVPLAKLCDSLDLVEGIAESQAGGNAV